MQDEIWRQFGMQYYNGAVLSDYSVSTTILTHKRHSIESFFCKQWICPDFH